MHVAIIGAGALIIFLVIGGLFMAAVVLEQRTRSQVAAGAAASVPVEVAIEPSPEQASTEKMKAMAAASGQS